MSLLEVKNLSRSFYRRHGFPPRQTSLRAVNDVSFEQNERQTLALIGESGAGKSTTARLVARVVASDSGSVTFDGIDWLGLDRESLRKARSKMQMVFQDPYTSFDPRITIGSSIGEPLLVHQGLRRADRAAQTATLLERVGLATRYMSRYPRELSGGQLQRAAIARALTTRPKLIICDEPVAALDVLIRAQVLNLLKDLQDEFGTAYLFITHDLSIVRAFADKVAIMQHGEIVEQGDVGQIYAEPRHPYTRTLLDAAPKLTPKSQRVAVPRAAASTT
jgi:ABC-type glutathione transport system ATPase component